MSRGASIALRAFQVVVYCVLAWQLVGLIPALLWLQNPSAVTSGMSTFLIVKFIIAGTLLAIGLLLGKKLKTNKDSLRKRNTTKPNPAEIRRGK